MALQVLQLHLAQVLHVLVAERIQVRLGSNVAGVAAENKTEDSHAAAALLAWGDGRLLAGEEPGAFLICHHVVLSSGFVDEFACGLIDEGQLGLLFLTFFGLLYLVLLKILVVVHDTCKSLLMNFFLALLVLVFT